MDKKNIIEDINEHKKNDLIKDVTNKKKFKKYLGNILKKNEEDKKNLLSNKISNEKTSLAKTVEIALPALKSKKFCLIEESPYYIHRVIKFLKLLSFYFKVYLFKIAQTDNFKEFEKIYNDDPSLLFVKDNLKKWTPIQFAAYRNKIKIIDFILERTEPSKIILNFYYNLYQFNFIL